jgi:predicted TIM-barrel fold metal-dependent hydrolase
VKKIAIEEHVNEEDLNHLEKRLKDMDEAGIDMQVLSFFFPPREGVDATSMAKSANDRLAKVVEKYPKRFAAFAAIPLQNPDAAANELERAVKQLGFKGTLIPSNPGGGEYLDEQKYRVIFEMAQKLDMPVYIHPGGPSPDTMKPYLAYPVLSRAMWAFGAEAGLDAMRLICSGLFDKYPGLKIILGHMGEGIPYFLWRIDNRWLKEKDGQPGAWEADPIGGKLKKKPSQYFKDNFYVSTSGMFWHPVLQFVCLVLGADRILFAADYPPESAMEAAQFIETAPISDSDKEKICHLNAEKLLRL